MVTHLVNMGYVRNEAVRAAPYDFRVAPSKCHHGHTHTIQLTITFLYGKCNSLIVCAHMLTHNVTVPICLTLSDEQEEYFSRLKKLIEDMYEQYQQPLYILGHSMGSNYVLYFLYQQTQAWKDQYIKGFISLGAPWGGAVKPLRVLASGTLSQSGGQIETSPIVET